MTPDTRKVQLIGGDYEHTMALSGVRDGIEINYVTGSIMDIFRRMIAERAYEACEFSLSNYIGLKASGADWLHAIPVFPNRNFRHNTLFVRRDSDLNDPRQLRNKRIGVQEYSMTAAVWVRGFLNEQYGIHWSELDWYCEARHRRVSPPEGARVMEVSTDIESLLLAGDVDVIVAFAPQDEKLPISERRLRRLFSNPEEVERAYFRETGIYPINHCVVIRQDLLGRIPEVPATLFKAYTESKRRAYERGIGATMIPWGKRYWTDVLDFFGGDPLRYGMTAGNRKVVGKLISYLYEQRLIPRELPVDDLFVQDSLTYQE